MIKQTRWVALFSQTGSEIIELSEKLGRFPDLILTNCLTPEKQDRFHPKLRELDLHFIQENTPEEYSKYFEEEDLITLHGYLKILPPETCKSFNIFNGHPGLITVYPELKGKDPQTKAFEAKHTSIGSVIHRCTEVLDAGPICVERRGYVYENSAIETYYKTLRRFSLEAWMAFFESYATLS